MANHYEVPNWAGKPPTGLHLDVLKEEKLVQKLMVDEKKCYLFGRNQELNDFCIDHGSCSRVHAALVYHKHLNRAFLVDLGSTHGTYIGNIRLESHKPTQLLIDSIFHFGASTRYYVIRERPHTTKTIIDELEKTGEDQDSGGLLGLPETETEINNLTEFNTARNKKISMLGITDEKIHKSTRKGKNKNISFNDHEEVINPEDIDSSVGRFRNLLQTTVVPSKRMRMEGGLISRSEETYSSLKYMQPTSIVTTLYHKIPAEQCSSTTLSMGLPNPAPDVEMLPSQTQTEPLNIPDFRNSTDPIETKKKKYAKEAWPQKNLLV